MNRLMLLTKQSPFVVSLISIIAIIKMPEPIQSLLFKHNQPPWLNFRLVCQDSGQPECYHADCKAIPRVPMVQAPAGERQAWGKIFRSGSWWGLYSMSCRYLFLSFDFGIEMQISVISLQKNK